MFAIARSRPVVHPLFGGVAGREVLLHLEGREPAMSSISSALRRPSSGSLLYSPSFHAGSRSMASMNILRHMRLRPAIWTGRQAKGIRASTNSGYVSPQTKVCMQPIEVPRIRRRWSTCRPWVSMACWPPPCRHSRSPGKRMCRPSQGLHDFPWPMSSGRIMKYLLISSSWPGPNSTAANCGATGTGPVAAGAVQDQHGVVHMAGRSRWGAPRVV